MVKVNPKLPKSFHGHESVTFFNDPETGLVSFVAIHSSKLGPAVGGTRFFPYHNMEEALNDVLRLSKSMTYKCALAGVPFGGGKGVIISTKGLNKKKILAAYAKRLNVLNGNFYTGQDMGITDEDVSYMLKHSSHFIGKPGYAGEPAPYAALSVFYSIQAAAKYKFKTEDLTEKTVAIKGIGNVGSRLLKLLLDAGCNVVVADKDQKRAAILKKKFPKIKLVKNDQIHKVKCDIYAPCAIGNEFTGQTAKEVKAKIICGGANNQLASPEVGEYLHKRGILYVPDYVANSGGLINVVDELNPKGYNRDRVKKKILEIKGTVQKILAESEKRGIAANMIADEMAERIINA